MEENDLIYSNARAKEEYLHVAKIFSSYIGLIMLWLFTVSTYKSFGEKWLLPAISLMWVMGAITSYVIAEDRDFTIKETKFAILGYCLFLLLYKWVLQHIVSVTSSQLGASLNIGTTSASGIAASSMLQNLLIWLSLMIPIGFVIWCAKKFKVFRGRKTKSEELKKLKGFNENRRVR